MTYEQALEYIHSRIHLGTRKGLGRMERLMEKLRGYLLYTMPTSAVGGTFSEELSVRRVYTRSGSATNYDDMVLLVNGMAPAVYTDAEGNRIKG